MQSRYIYTYILEYMIFPDPAKVFQKYALKNTHFNM